MGAEPKSSLGQTIDAVIDALQALDEAARLTAVKAACEHLDIALVPSGPNAGGAASPSLTPPPPAETPQHKIGDIRSLRNAKNPRGAIEMACIVAYYLENLAPTSEKRAEIVTKDIEKYFKQANYALPKAIRQLLINARAAGYFDSAGRGEYRLNPVGHNLVAHTLPRPKGKK